MSQPLLHQRRVRVGAFVLALSLAWLLAAPAANPLAAQQQPGTSLELTPYAGYLVSGSLAEGPLGTSVKNANSMVLGGQLGLRMSRYVALVGNVARASTDLRVSAPIVGGMNVGRNAMWLFDGGLQLGGPLPGGVLPIAPFVQVGAGAVRNEVSNSFVNTTATNFAWNAGAGVDLALAPNLGIRLMVKDYVGKFDVQEATGVNLEGRTTHNWALSAGLKLAF